MDNYHNGNPGDTGGYQGGEVDNRKRVAAGTIAGNPARKRWKGMKIRNYFEFSRNIIFKKCDQELKTFNIYI